MSAGEMDENDAKKEKEESLEVLEALEKLQKNQHLLEAQSERLQSEHFEKMMFYLECDMNLLVYGVGSKKDIL